MKTCIFGPLHVLKHHDHYTIYLFYWLLDAFRFTFETEMLKEMPNVTIMARVKISKSKLLVMFRCASKNPKALAKK